MRLIRTGRDDLKLVTFKNERNLPAYAILSHTWLDDEEEVTFGDLDCPDRAKTKPGWKKLTYAMDQASRDGFEYLWIDTCCIDKSSSAELTESINSMFRWYQQAAVCYVYLSDMPTPDSREKSTLRSEIDLASAAPCHDVKEMNRRSMRVVQSNTSVSLVETRPREVSPASRTNCRNIREASERLRNRHHGDHEPEDEPFGASVEPRSLSSRPGSRFAVSSQSSSLDMEQFGACKWFTRGWTLQEMMAPSVVQFFSASWTPVGALTTLTVAVSNITGIHVDALSRKRPLSSFSIAQKMCWAATRQTTRIEDQAYSLLGIFSINMPIIYGEGEAAFVRMQEELLRVYSDHTIFAWSSRSDCWVGAVNDNWTAAGLDDMRSSGLLATSVSAFRNCDRLVPAISHQADQAYELTSKAVTFDLPTFDSGSGFLQAILDCRFEDDCTREVAIKLTTAGSDTYEVLGESREPRVQLFDTYAMSLMYNAKSKKKFSILRHGSSNDVTSQAVPRPHQIVCRIKVNNKFQTTAPFFTMSPWGYTNAGHWDARTNSFYLHCHCNDDASSSRRSPFEICSGIFEGGLELRRDRLHLGRLKIIKRREITRYPVFLEDRQIEFERGDRPVFHWGSVLALILSISTRMNVRNGIIIVADYRMRYLHHDLVELVEISIYPILDTFTGYMVTMGTMLIAFIWCALRISALMPSAAIPIATIARRQAHIDREPNHNGLSAPDHGLFLGLKLALPLSCLLSLILSFKKDRVFGMGSATWRDSLKPIEAMRYHFQQQHRMLLFGLTILNNLAIATMSIILASSSSKHVGTLHNYNAQLHSSHLRLGLYVTLPELAIISAALALTSAVAFASYRFLCRHTPLKTVGGKMAIVSILSHVVVIVPFTMITDLSVLTPWNSNDCLDARLFSSVTDVYEMIATSESQSLEHVCTSLAFEGKLALSILSLSVYDLIVNIWTAGYVTWLVIRINNLPLKAKLRVF